MSNLNAKLTLCVVRYLSYLYCRFMEKLCYLIKTYSNKLASIHLYILYNYNLMTKIQIGTLYIL